MSIMAAWSPGAAAPATPGIPSTSFPPHSRFPLLPGVTSRLITTPRLTQHVYESGPADAETVVLLHGNMSSGRFFESTMTALADYHVLAPDLRGFGASERRVVDATRGVADYADDLAELLLALRCPAAHLLGWSLGGNVAIHFLIAHPDQVLTLTLLSPGSPYGYGGTHGLDGQPNFPDCAGSGAGLVRREITARLRLRDAGVASLFSPRAMFRQSYVRSVSRITRTREDALVEQILLMALGDEHYPGDSLPSFNWPYTAPGVFGPNNAVSPKYLDQRALAEVRTSAPILWLRGANDRLVSDAALTDPATLGKLRLLPRWPGETICPPQPMVSQMRALLRGFVANGGSAREEVLPNCGHSPHLEQPEAFQALLRSFLRDRPTPAEERATGAAGESATPRAGQAPGQPRLRVVGG